jgi:SAM-dependent methyltransferase
MPSTESLLTMDADPRPLERIRVHYEVEKELAGRLLRSTRQERTRLFRTLYDELFARVPDHPRLIRRETPEASRHAVESRMNLLRPHLDGVRTFVEFAPGDCRLAFEMCHHAENVVGVDISDQCGSIAGVPANFALRIYDGYNLDMPDQSVDMVFSYQFIEHLHPDDVEPHFALVKRLLRPGGAYIFSTPHRFSGPHDVSAYFSDVPEGFHFKEWTFSEMAQLVTRIGFGGWHSYRFGRVRQSWLMNGLTLAAEAVAGALPRHLQKRASSRLFQSVTMLVRR